MGLNDLLLEIKQDQNSFLGDENTENKVLRQVLSLVEDKISEVKNQAVKWSVPFYPMMNFDDNLSILTVWVNSLRSFANHKWYS